MSDRDCIGKFPDLHVQLAHLVDPTPVVVCAPDRIDAIPDVRTQTQTGRACASADDGGQTVTFGGHAREVIGEFFEVELFLISEFKDSSVCVRISEEGLEME